MAYRPSRVKNKIYEVRCPACHEMIEFEYPKRFFQSIAVLCANPKCGECIRIPLKWNDDHHDDELNGN